MIRGIVISILEGAIKRITASGRTDETIEDREYFQHYGFTSRPKAGAEIIFIREGNHIIAVASDDRRYRLALADGEVALYDCLGQKIHLKADGSIDVEAINKVTVTAPQVNVVATTKVLMTTPLLEVTGSIKAGENITAVGNVADADGAKTMAAMRTVYNSHTQNDPQGGVVGAPNQQM